MLALFKKKMRANGLVGIGLSDDGIAVARVIREEGAPPVLDACVFEPATDVGARARALESVVKGHELDDTTCSVVLEAGSYSLLLVEAPDVPPEELRAAVSWRIRELIDFHIDDAVIDVFDVPGQKAMGGNRMMYTVAARIPSVRQKTEMVQDAGLDLGVVDIHELAQRNLAAQLPEDVSGVALLYIAANTGVITLTRQSNLYLARRIEFGVDSLGPVASGSGDDDDAAQPPPQAVGWLDGLVVEVQRSMDYYESHFTEAPITNLVIAPLDRPVPGMVNYLSQQTGMTVRSLELKSVIDIRGELDAAAQVRCFPAIGAALRAEARSL